MTDYEFHLYEEARAGRLTRRELLRRASVAGVSVTALAPILAACGGDEPSGQETDTGGTSETPQRGGVIRVGLYTPPADVDPITMYHNGAYDVVETACEYLCFPRADYTLDPRLATEWTAGENPQTWTFTLREGVRWHDGSPLTADDVVATFDRITDPEVNSAALSNFQGILSKGNTEAAGPYEVTFHLDRPYADFPYLVCAFNYNAAILPRNYEVGDFIKGGIGTGPFVLQEYTPKTGARFVRNENYWDTQLPYADEVTVTFYAEDPPMANALQTGAIDVYPSMPFQGNQALFSNPDVAVLESSSSQYRTLQMRTDQAPFDTREVRQALAYCLDREALVQSLFDGRAEVGNDHAFAPIYPVSELALQEVPQRTPDIEQAQALLAQAGHTGGLSATLTTMQSSEIPQYAVSVQEMSRPAGFDIELDIQPVNDYYGSGDNQPWLEVPLGITDWGARGSASQTITPAYLCGAVWNSAHWCDERFDQAVARLEAEADLQRQKELAVEAARIQHEEVPDIIAYWIKELRATRTNVHDLAAGPVLHLDLRGVWLS
jgi:peptide/nickel transport system substrate-binding protein